MKEPTIEEVTKAIEDLCVCNLRTIAKRHAEERAVLEECVVLLEYAQGWIDPRDTVPIYRLEAAIQRVRELGIGGEATKHEA